MNSSSLQKSATQPSIESAAISLSAQKQIGDATFRIDPEFAALLPQVADVEWLKSELRSPRGFVDSLKVWKEGGILLDGHTRLRVWEEVSKQHSVPAPEVKYLSFASRKDAAWFALNLQAERRNLTPIQVAFVIHRNRELFDKVTSEAAERRKNGRNNKSEGRSKQILAKMSNGKTSEYALTVAGEVECEIAKAKALEAKAATEQEKASFTAYRQSLEELKGRAETNELSARLTRQLVAKLSNRNERSVRAQKASKVKLAPLPEGSLLDHIHHADVIEGLQKLHNGSIDLTITSPPYPLEDVKYPHWEYEGDYAKYLRWMEDIFTVVYTKTKEGGECAINIVECSDQTGAKRITSHKPLLFVPGDVVAYMTRIGWTLKDTIIWYKQKFNGTRPAAGSSTPTNPRYQRSWEHILIFRKGDGDEGRDCDLLPQEWSKWQDGHWAITPETKRENIHRCPFPPEIPRRLIKRHTYKGDLVVDPFSGSGTTCWVAAGLGRRFYGIDNDPKSVALSRQRLKKPFVDPYTPDPLDELTPKRRIDKLLNFAMRQRVQDYGDKMKGKRK